MHQWHLEERVVTSAGEVAAGSAGDGPPLVLAHGWPWSSFSWHRVIPALAERFRLFWFDMPGYGRSNKEFARNSLDVQGAVFAEMLDHWGLSKPAVLAHDFGGATTLRAHLLHGCEYEVLTLMNVVAVSPWGSDFFDHVGRHVAAFEGLPPHIHRAVVEAYIAGAFAKPLRDDDATELAQPWLSEAGKISFYRQFAQADERYTDEIEGQYGTIRCPVRILWGDADPWIPVARGRSLHDLIPGSSFDLLSGAGHMPQLEAPELVLEKLATLDR
ncbi:alpha/beta fold hydrolase [Croceicoccus gelatinilyticus]|uniref:alpha/beta fold hydrolase n=1 Tax=Croceicoccus gelatinilyticus TaxID=2835536 RepID=UPI001BCA6A02|nr:alpha/beta hydrolase [Croceicoccus gelatinilyticus]MBS7669604.1 alpha/beta hydrolase [Croceicoccus gelatinilyticus]